MFLLIPLWGLGDLEPLEYLLVTLRGERERPSVIDIRRGGDRDMLRTEDELRRPRIGGDREREIEE